MKRPVPVILTAILLGLFAVQIAITMAAMGVVFLPSHPQPFIGFLGILLSCAGAVVWLIWTLVGLIRLRSWARYSILVIAGLMVFYGASCAIKAARLIFTSDQPGAKLEQSGPFFIWVAIYALFTAIGLAQLVYYNLAKTRTLFLARRRTSVIAPD
jgi:hypothetical protein